MQKQEVDDNLKKLAVKNKHKKYLIEKDIRTVPKLDFYMKEYYGGIGKALSAVGLPSSKLAAAMKITNEDLLKYLRDLRDTLGRKPKTRDMRNDKEIYKAYSDYKISWSIYKTRFGGFMKAIDLLGKKGELFSRRIDDNDYFWGRRLYWGEAAELHAMAELLYHGFQAANIPVDVGLDILAVKNNKTYYFQVKHKDLSDNQSIKITKSSFEKTGGGEVYYIFVLLSDKKRDFLIVPYHLINGWIKEKIVQDTDDGYLVHVKRSKEKDEQYLLKEKVLDNYLNNWDDIR